MGEHGKYRALVNAMLWRPTLLTIALVAGLVPSLAQAQTACRQALALGLDISGSVDEREYRLQMNGLAAAIEDPTVIDGFLALPDAPVRLFIYEWAGLETQRVLLDWVIIQSDQQLYDIADNLRNQPRRPRQVATALGVALQFGGAALAKQKECWQRTLDISGDGESNMGPRPGDPEVGRLLDGITVNGLVIGTDAATAEITATDLSDLTNYYQSEVARGPENFVETALDFEDYQKAMKRKLLREMEVIAIGRAD